MLQPARTKYRKQQKGRNTGVATRGAKVSFGEYGLKATTRGRLTARQLEAGRRAMSRHIKRGGRIWIRVFPDKPVSQKPAEVRMGNGKGNPEYFVSEIQPGKIIIVSKKYHAHVESGEFGEGDLVEIAECRPISRTKSWRVTRLVEKSKAV